MNAPCVVPVGPRSERTLRRSTNNRERQEHMGIQHNGSLAPDCWWKLLV
jgi:hypothetical protein